MVIARVALTIINIIIKKRHHNNKHYDLKMIHGFNQSKISLRLSNVIFKKQQINYINISKIKIKQTCNIIYYKSKIKSTLSSSCLNGDDKISYQPLYWCDIGLILVLLSHNQYNKPILTNIKTNIPVSYQTIILLI